MARTLTLSDVPSAASDLLPAIGSLPSMDDTFGALLLGSFLNIL